jgi:hypothetical protein
MPDLGELIGVVILAIMGAWGLWFGWQSIVGLWWPLNLAYGMAGLAVAGIAAAVARAVLRR